MPTKCRNAFFKVYQLAKIARYLKYAHPIVIPTILFAPIFREFLFCAFVPYITGRSKEKRENDPPTQLICSLNSSFCNTIHKAVSSNTLRECLDEILDDVVDVLDPDRDTDEISCDSAGEPLCFCELLMGGREGMDNQGPDYGSAGVLESTVGYDSLSVPNVSKVRCQL